MKPNYIMLSMIIPGLSSSGNDIDVYLQQLNDELKELWEFGVETLMSNPTRCFKYVKRKCGKLVILLH